tara:strand:- start:317 stop:1108 length:792 start_codon:yes stop_codon:yes gene_type:complete
MQALVINLERSKSRLEYQKKQLEGLSIPFERINAIDANKLDDKTYEANANHWERPLRRTEVACALSHLSAWERVKRDNNTYLILEDDALLSSHTKLITDALVSRTDYDCVNLETRARRKRITRKKTTLCNGFHLSGLIQDKSGAAAYVLWPSGAQRLLEWIDKNGIGLTDATLALGPRWKHGQLVPAAAIQMDCCDFYDLKTPIQTSSNINNTPKPVTSKSLFVWRRLKAQIRIATRKLITIATAENVNLRPQNITPCAFSNG